MNSQQAILVAIGLSCMTVIVFTLPKAEAELPLALPILVQMSGTLNRIEHKLDIIVNQGRR